jgi:uncharacterized protein with ATP-grasp and redox domains
MKTSLDCVPCFLRQTIDAVRMASADSSLHERIVREVLFWASDMVLDESPPVLGQRIHRRLRELTGVEDPYRMAKDHLNRLALSLLPELKTEIEAAPDPLITAVRLAIAGNVMDLGVNRNLRESDVRDSIRQALAEPFAGEQNGFRQAVGAARSILYLADNAGEIAIDRLLIEQLSPARVTLAVRGAAVINDATMADARAVGLYEIVETIDNGSDAPGTVLEDCSENFRQRFSEADLVLAKGQGNFETLSEEPRDIFFLFKVKCPLVAAHVGLPVGTHVLARSHRNGGARGGR